MIKLILSEGIEKIGEKAFYENDSLVSITLPSAVNSLGVNAFYKSYHLVEIYNFSQISLKIGGKDGSKIETYALNIYTKASDISRLSPFGDDYIVHKTAVK